MQGWERDDRMSLERGQAVERSTEYKERAARGPYVVRRSDLSTDEELVQIAIPSAHWDGNPRLDTNCLVYRDLASRSSAMVCPGADGYDLTDDSMGDY